MTKDDLIRMADLVGYDVDDDDDVHAPASGRYGLDPRLEHFAQLVAGYALRYEQPNVSTKSQNVDTSEECVQETDKSIHEPWDTSDMAHRSGGLNVEQEPVAYRKEAHGMWFYIENKPSPPNDDYEPLYTAPPKRENELDIADQAYFAGKEAGVAVGEAETKHWKDLAEYRLQLLMKMPEQRAWVGLTDEEIVACGWCDLRFARAIEAKLRERNT